MGGFYMSHDITHVIDRAFIFVPVANQAAANVEAAAWDEDTGGGDTFNEVWLSADGGEPATHYGACTPANAAMKTAINAALEPSHVFWESAPITWDGALTAAGLQVINRSPL